MNTASVTPCGLICDLCMGFQRKNNRCVGCNNEGEKPGHCSVCIVRRCPEKQGNEQLSCAVCTKLPCRRIRDLDRRYRTRYGVHLLENLQLIARNGIDALLERTREQWTCEQCGELLCVHRSTCLRCGAPNGKYPDLPADAFRS